MNKVLFVGKCKRGFIFIVIKQKISVTTFFVIFFIKGIDKFLCQ